MALKDYTTHELIEELRGRDDVFMADVWMRDDVKSCFPEKSDEEVTEFMELHGGAFKDCCTEEGWEIMNALDC